MSHNPSFLPDTSYPEVGMETACADMALDNLFGAWQDFKPGMYLGTRYKLRVLMRCLDPELGIVPNLTALSWVVDMLDRVEQSSGVTCPVGGLVVTFNIPFQAIPNVQVTILNAQSGDYPVVTGPDGAGLPTTAGYEVLVKNGANAVERTVNLYAQGY